MWGGMLLGIAYGLLIEPAWIEVTHHSIRLQSPGEAVRIVQLSDLHLHGMGRIEESLIEKVNALKPDVILMSGDVVDRVESMAALDAFLGRIEADAKLAVLGNWEYWSGVDLVALKKIYERHGVRLLVNECVPLALNDRHFNVAGLDDFTAGRPYERRLGVPCGDAGIPRIMVQHSPGYFERLPAVNPEIESILNLSGHTHGGQIALFGHAFLTPPGSGTFNRGWYSTAYGPLYVSRGIGSSVLPVRVGSRPEIAVFDLSP